MILVDVDTPGVNIVRDVATMEHPQEHFGRYGGHAEIVYENVRVPEGGAARQGGRGLPDRPAPARPGPHPPLHALARASRSARSTCSASARSRATRSARSWPRSRPSRTGSRTRMAQMHAARLMTLHAAWKMDNEGASRRAHRDQPDQVLRRERAARRDRPRDPDPWGTWVLDRPAAWSRCTATPAPRGSTTAPTRSTASRSPAASCAATSRTSVPSEHVPTRREAARERFADLLEAVTSND